MSINVHIKPLDAKYFQQGSCQAVFRDRNFVYKVPLVQKFDAKHIDSASDFKNLKRILRKQLKYISNYRKFQKVIKIFNQLENVSENLNEFFLETTVCRVRKIEFIINNTKVFYSGKLFKQEFVDSFFGNKVSLKTFNWKDITDIQTQLWKYGVGLSAPAETWGPKNWAKTRSNKIRLADFSSLSTSYKEVSEVLKTNIKERRKNKMLSFPEYNTPKEIEEYFAFMDNTLNIENLKKNWCKYRHVDILQRGNFILS